MSFHMQKKRLGLQRNQIFNQGFFFSFFLGGGGREGAKLFGELCVALKKSYLRPCACIEKYR